MLNSAAGVTFPSPIEPPISTIRAGRDIGVAGEHQPDVRQRADRHEGLAVGVAAQEVHRVLLERRALRRRQIGPVEAGLTVDVLGDVRLSDDGRSAPAATVMSVRPENSRIRIAFAVVFSSVWLPATVVTPISSISGLASARRSAMASS